MRTGELVKRSGLERETLRFYESKGLLPKPNRASSGYRMYDRSVLARLAFIRNAKEAGFTLREISDLLDLKEKNATCRDGRDIARLKVAEVDKKMAALRRMKKKLLLFVTACESEGEKGLAQRCHLSFETISKVSKKGTP